MQVAIIGNGIAGITAARFIRKLSNFDITVISSESDYFFSRPALMYIFMGHLRYEDTKPYEDWFWEKNRIELRRGRVESVHPESKTLFFNSGEQLVFDKLLIASGSKYNLPDCPGIDLAGVSGLYHLQDLERIESCSKKLENAVIVGGGLIGIELAEMLHSRQIPVTFLVREHSFFDMVLPEEESRMVNERLKKYGIDLKLDTGLKEILDDGHGKVAAVTATTGERIRCGFVGITIGVSPNIESLQKTSIECNRGILVDEYLQTSHPDIFAAGDCAELRFPRPGRQSIEAVWYTARMMGEVAAYNICGVPQRYDPGLWFNSAKFLDLEYQVYGTVHAHNQKDFDSIFWQHPLGNKSIRIVYERATEVVSGFLLMGIRYRQEVCEKWLRQRTTVADVLSKLSLANFDTEFSREFERDLIEIFNRKQNRNLSTDQRSGLKGVIPFLKQ